MPAGETIAAPSHGDRPSGTLLRGFAPALIPVTTGSRRPAVTGIPAPGVVDCIGETTSSVCDVRGDAGVDVGLVDGATQRVSREQTEVTGTVEAVDHTGRSVTIRLQPGSLVTLDVPPNAGPFRSG